MYYVSHVCVLCNVYYAQYCVLCLVLCTVSSTVYCTCAVSLYTYTYMYMKSVIAACNIPHMYLSLTSCNRYATRRAGKLHTYFAKHDYHFVTALYGNKFDGYMVRFINSAEVVVYVMHKSFNNSFDYFAHRVLVWPSHMTSTA